MKRRDILYGAGALSAALLIPGMATAAGRARTKAVNGFVRAKTRAGDISGIEVDGIKQFRGVPYGASTAGANRFLAPKPPEAWTGVRPCYGFGNISPQAFSAPLHPFGRLIEFDLHAGGMGEDCLNLNIWTPALDDAKRPVIVYFHGGGYTAGSANHDLYEGDSLARFGDAVVVTVNHRLSAFGYVNLTDLGAPARFADAGNAGHLDMVRSLEWIRDNIAGFGGDPTSVTIFGQSGGGSKVWALMAMPAAKGLFHKALVQSGSLNIEERVPMREATEALIANLGVAKGDWDALQAVSFERLVEAQIAIGGYNWISSEPRPGPTRQFGPWVDGRAMPWGMLDKRAFANGADVPVVIGYCLHDSGWPMPNFDLDDAGLRGVAGQLAGADKAGEAVDLYTRAYPADSPFLLQAAMMTDQHLARISSDTAARKTALGRAPAWVYRFDWRSTAFEGQFGATHGMDMALVFNNPNQPTVGGDSAASRALANGLAGALCALARNGDPSGEGGYAGWTPHTDARRETLVIDYPRSRVVADPGRDLRLFWDGTKTAVG